MDPRKGAKPAEEAGKEDEVCVARLLQAAVKTARETRIP
mgnify:CR=1 FL=1